LFYVEFIERDRFMPVEIFRHLGRQSSGWAEETADRLVLQLGRTLRLGSVPAYMAFWEIDGIDRLDAWETYFASEEAIRNARSQAMHRAIHIKEAGVYDTRMSALEAPAPLYYAEFHDTLGPPGEESRGCVGGEPAAGSRLALALERVGWIGPAAGGLALWAQSRSPPASTRSSAPRRSERQSPSSTPLRRSSGRGAEMML
jgi:hypothetical protein